MTGALAASPWTTWGIAAAATAGVIFRPFSWPEFVWAVAGAVLLVAFGLLSLPDAIQGVARGADVYLFLLGMMLLAELARQEGLFDWLAARAARMAKGSPTRLFTLVFGVGTVVTALLSNDATAVVLTPAVGHELVAALADLPANVVEAGFVPVAVENVLSSLGMEVYGVDRCPVHVEDDGLGHV